jgi:hypothetical protein
LAFDDGGGLGLVRVADGDAFVEEAGADVVVVGAGVDGRGFFDGDIWS